MKKYFNHAVAIVSLTVLSMSPSHSQELALNSKKGNFFGSGTTDVSADTKPISEVNEKVMKSFQKSFGNKPGLVWGKTVEQTYFAFYKEDSKSNYAYFNDNGRLQYFVSQYGEASLPTDVKRTLTSKFNFDSIKHVSEVRKDGDVWYFVKIGDKTSIKTIRIAGDQWEVVEVIKTK